MNKTPLFERHVAMGATMAEFGGWDMPLWYKTGQTAEHKATREIGRASCRERVLW